MNPGQLTAIVLCFAMFVILCALYFYIFKCMKTITKKFLDAIEKEMQENG